LRQRQRMPVLFTVMDEASTDAWLETTLHTSDPTLEACLAANAQAGLPAIDVSPLQGKFLCLIARIQNAHRILEIGALGGYSTIWLARALPADGCLISLELDPKHAAVARSNVARAGFAEKVEIIEGPAIESLVRLRARGQLPFDLIFIDADKTGYPAYLAASLHLSRPGTVIIGDNVVRRGEVADPNCPDEHVRGARKFIELMGAEPRLEVTVIQTVGRKGHDGLSIARVIS